MAEFIIYLLNQFASLQLTPLDKSLAIYLTVRNTENKGELPYNFNLYLAEIRSSSSYTGVGTSAIRKPLQIYVNMRMQGTAPRPCMQRPCMQRPCIPATSPHVAQRSNHTSLSQATTMPGLASMPMHTAHSSHNAPTSNATRRVATSASASAGWVQEEATEQLDRNLMIKISLANSTGRLDLTDCRMDKIPDEVFDIADLEVR